MPTIDLGSVVGPQGPQGATGPQGPQGIQGPVGPAGGVNSVNGVTGDVVIGGRNLVLDSGGERSATSASASKMGPIWTLSDYGKEALAVPGTALVISYYAKSSVAGQQMNINIRGSSNSNNATTLSAANRVTLTTEYQRFVIRTAINADAENVAARLCAFINEETEEGAATVSVKNVKVELGSVATEYLPAPDDLESRVAALESAMLAMMMEV